MAEADDTGKNISNSVNGTLYKRMLLRTWNP